MIMLQTVLAENDFSSLISCTKKQGFYHQNKNKKILGIIY